jgi:hypothetical protein
MEINLKNIVATIEAVAGLTVFGISIWSLSNILSCPEDSWDCEGWAMFGAYIVSPIGLFIVVAGVILMKTKSWYSQIVFLPAVAWGCYWWLM